MKEWHERYGALPDPGRCAGCSDELPDVWGSFCAMAPGYISTACMAPIASSPTAGGGVAPPLQRCACSARTARRLRAVVMDDFTLTQTSEVDFPYGEREGESQLPESASTPSAPLSAPASSNAIRRPRRVLPAEQVGNEIALAINPASLCAALGIDDPNVATRLLSHLVNVYQSLAFKAMRTFAQLLDTLYPRSRKGGDATDH